MQAQSVSSAGAERPSTKLVLVVGVALLDDPATAAPGERPHMPYIRTTQC
jgi:hypothetical protein